MSGLGALSVGVTGAGGGMGLGVRATQTLSPVSRKFTFFIEIIINMDLTFENFGHDIFLYNGSSTRFNSFRKIILCFELQIYTT